MPNNSRNLKSRLSYFSNIHCEKFSVVDTDSENEDVDDDDENLDEDESSDEIQRPGCSTGQRVTLKQKQDAVSYRYTPTGKPRKLSQIQHRYRFVTSSSQLCRWKEQVDRSES